MPHFPQEKADQAGMECHLLIKGVSTSENYATQNDFLFGALGVE